MKIKQKMTTEEFIAKYPIGTPVLYHNTFAGLAYQTLRTAIRSDPWLIGDGELVVKIDGITGCVACSHIEPYPEYGVYAGFPEEFNDSFTPGTTFRLQILDVPEKFIEVLTTGAAFLSDDDEVMVPVQTMNDELSTNVSVNRLLRMP